jgi:hypothetical protein
VREVIVRCTGSFVLAVVVSETAKESSLRAKWFYYFEVVPDLGRNDDLVGKTRFTCWIGVFLWI